LGITRNVRQNTASLVYFQHTFKLKFRKSRAQRYIEMKKYARMRKIMYKKIDVKLRDIYRNFFQRFNTHKMHFDS